MNSIKKLLYAVYLLMQRLWDWFRNTRAVKWLWGKIKP